jgi:hypothetical protein
MAAVVHMTGLAISMRLTRAQNLDGFIQHNMQQNMTSVDLNGWTQAYIQDSFTYIGSH